MSGMTSNPYTCTTTLRNRSRDGPDVVPERVQWVPASRCVLGFTTSCTKDPARDVDGGWRAGRNAKTPLYEAQSSDLMRSTVTVGLHPAAVRRGSAKLGT